MYCKNTIRSLMPTALGVFAVASLAGCGGGSSSTNRSSTLPPAVAAAQRSATPVSPALVAANNNFGIQLLNQARLNDAGNNVFVSSPSVSIAFEIAYNGAAGTTATAMAQTLGLTSTITSPADLNSANAALQASFVSTDPGIQLTVANSFWYRKATGQILQSFVDTDTQFYGAQIGDLAGAPNNINAWVSNATNGTIPKIVDQSIQTSVAAIVNAVYFKGAWSSPFDTALTTSGTFTLANGTTTVPCSLMNQQGLFSYHQGSNYQAVKLPYGKGGASMLLVLPSPGTSVDGLLSAYNNTSLMTLRNELTSQGGSISVPRFTTSYTLDLKQALSAMGMSLVFDPNQANFSNMGKALFIDSAIHKTYLAVNEAGTVASGATSIGVGATSAPTISFTMNLNRPFICAILDENTGELLFIGAIDHP